jgi:hypothetical protein
VQFFTACYTTNPRSTTRQFNNADTKAISSSLHSSFIVNSSPNLVNNYYGKWYLDATVNILVVMLVFRLLTPCGIVDTNVSENILPPSSGMNYVPPKHWYLRRYYPEGQHKTSSPPWEPQISYHSSWSQKTGSSVKRRIEMRTLLQWSKRILQTRSLHFV